MPDRHLPHARRPPPPGAALGGAVGELSGDDSRVVAERLARVETACAAGRASACGAHRGAGYDHAAESMGRWSGPSRGAGAAEPGAAEPVERCPQTRSAPVGV